MKKVLAGLIIVLSAQLAHAGAPTCIVTEKGNVIKTIDGADSSQELAPGSKAVVSVSFTDGSFSLCLFSDISPDAVVVCTEGQSVNMSYEGKKVSCSKE